MPKSNIFILSGPSGAGEDSIISALEKQLPIERVITTTTRAPRPGESQGQPYYFISRKEFENKRQKGELIEHARHYNGQFYGVTREELERVRRSGKIGMWKIEYQGVETAKKMFSKIIAILINAPLDQLEKRIRRRDNASEEYVRERMGYTKEWLKHKGIYDYEVLNEDGKLNEAVNAVAKIIKSNA